MSKTAYIGIGTNMGDRMANLREALERLRKSPDCRVRMISKVYETAPIGYTEQDSFLNIALELETEFSPEELLAFTASIETEMGRKRLIHWGPRVIDLDILIFQGVRMDTEKLSIPHPRITERAFVMVPLLEIGPELELEGTKLKQYLEKIEDQKINIWPETLSS